jgi:hypothetical protein
MTTRWRPAIYIIALFTLSACFIMLPDAAAKTIASSDEVSWDISGYFKNFSSMTQHSDLYRDYEFLDQNTFWDNTARMRLRSEVYMGDVDFVAHYEASARYGDTQRARTGAEDLLRPIPGGEAILDQLFPEATPPRLLDLEKSETGDDYIVHHGVDRLFFRLRSGAADLTLGRSALTWGPGRFWNPTDYFAPFSPTEIDKEEKPGIDMFRALISIGESVSLDFVAAPVRRTDGIDDVDFENSGLAARASVNVDVFDLAASGGRIYDRYVAGFDAEGPIAGALVRLAVTRTSFENISGPERPDPFVQIMADIDYGFPWRWNPYLLLEYYYNGQGETDPDDYGELAQRPEYQSALRRGAGGNMGRHYGAFNFAVTPHPLVTLTEMFMMNLSDRSLYNGIYLAWSMLESLEIQFGANITVGEIPSEFGGYTDPVNGEDYPMPDTYFTYLKWYY